MDVLATGIAIGRMRGDVMTNREELIHALAQLDPVTFEDVITSAYQQRHDPDNLGSEAGPGTQATAEQFARWLAKRHLSSDAAIERIVYLPTGAADDEIRLLEVNRFLNAPEPDMIEPLDFTPDTDAPFKVFVADVTTDQWERIQRLPDNVLPDGWKLPGHQIIVRG
jgi:hypothetical protein